MCTLSYFLHTLGLIMLCSSVAANKEPLSNAKYKNPKEPLEVRIKNLMSHMTIEEKLGQMVQVERVNATTKVIKKYFIGMILVPPQKIVQNLYEYSNLSVLRVQGVRLAVEGACRRQTPLLKLG